MWRVVAMVQGEEYKKFQKVILPESTIPSYPDYQGGLEYLRGLDTGRGPIVSDIEPIGNLGTDTHCRLGEHHMVWNQFYCIAALYVEVEADKGRRSK